MRASHNCAPGAVSVGARRAATVVVLLGLLAMALCLGAACEKRKYQVRDDYWEANHTLKKLEKEANKIKAAMNRDHCEWPGGKPQFPAQYLGGPATSVAERHIENWNALQVKINACTTTCNESKAEGQRRGFDMGFDPAEFSRDIARPNTPSTTTPHHH